MGGLDRRGVREQGRAVSGTGRARGPGFAHLCGRCGWPDPGQDLLRERRAAARHRGARWAARSRPFPSHPRVPVVRCRHGPPAAPRAPPRSPRPLRARSANRSATLIALQPSSPGGHGSPRSRTSRAKQAVRNKPCETSRAKQAVRNKPCETSRAKQAVRNKPCETSRAKQADSQPRDPRELPPLRTAGTARVPSGRPAQNAGGIRPAPARTKRGPKLAPAREALRDPPPPLPALDTGVRNCPPYTSSAPPPSPRACRALDAHRVVLHLRDVLRCRRAGGRRQGGGGAEAAGTRVRAGPRGLLEGGGPGQGTRVRRERA
jgi:hypothetical protein